jgi:hypothetical protein
MNDVQCEARRKLLLLQGAMYRAEILALKVASYEEPAPIVMMSRLLDFLLFSFSQHRRIALMSAVIPKLFTQEGHRHAARCGLLMAAISLVIYWLATPFCIKSPAKPSVS